MMYYTTKYSYLKHKMFTLHAKSNLGIISQCSQTIPIFTLDKGFLHLFLLQYLLVTSEIFTLRIQISLCEFSICRYVFPFRKRPKTNWVNIFCCWSSATWLSRRDWSLWGRSSRINSTSWTTLRIYHTCADALKYEICSFCSWCVSSTKCSK